MVLLLRGESHYSKAEISKVLTSFYNTTMKETKAGQS